MLDISKLKKIPLFVYIVVLPLVLVSIYYGFFSIDRYVSTAKLVVRQPQEGAAASVPSLALLMGSANPTSREETLFVQDFILSLDMMTHLQKKLNWTNDFAQNYADPFYFLSADAPLEDQLKFYQRIVQTHFDELTGLLLVEVQAPTPIRAEQMLQEILTESERFVNEISHKIARDQMKFAESELAIARHNYEAKRNALIEFQNANNLLDAKSLAESRATTISELENTLTTERANLKALRSTLAPTSPQVRQQQIKIAAIEQQLNIEKQQLVSSADGARLNVVASQFQNLTVDAGIAEESYKLAVSALENSRIEASKKIRSLVTVASPHVAQEPIYPERLYNLATLVVLLLLMYGVARFIITTIEDHRD